MLVHASPFWLAVQFSLVLHAAVSIETWTPVQASSIDQRLLRRENVPNLEQPDPPVDTIAATAAAATALEAGSATPVASQEQPNPPAAANAAPTAAIVAPATANATATVDGSAATDAASVAPKETAATDAVPVAADASDSDTPGPPSAQVLKQCCSKTPLEVPVATKSASGDFEYSCMGASAKVLTQDEISKICGDNAGIPKKVPRKILDHHTMNMNPPTGGSETILSPPEITEKCCSNTPKQMPVAEKSDDGKVEFSCRGTKDGVSQKAIIKACLSFEVSPWRKTNLPAPSLDLVQSCCGKKEKERPVSHYWPSGAVTYSCEGVGAGWSMPLIEEVCRNMTKCAERYSTRDTPEGALSKMGNQGRFPPPTPELVRDCCSKAPRQCPVPNLEATGSYSYVCSGSNSNMTETAILETCQYLAIDSQIMQPSSPRPCESANCTNIQIRVPPAAIVTKCCTTHQFPIAVPTNDGTLTFTCVGESTGLSKEQIEEGCKKYATPKTTTTQPPEDA